MTGQRDEALKALWVRKNKGIQRLIARKLKVSKQLVSAVYWGKRSNHRIVRALKQARAPVVVGESPKRKAKGGGRSRSKDTRTG